MKQTDLVMHYDLPCPTEKIKALKDLCLGAFLETGHEEYAQIKYVLTVYLANKSRGLEGPTDIEETRQEVERIYKSFMIRCLNEYFDCYQFETQARIAEFIYSNIEKESQNETN